ncbi:hypothetical protein BGZ83_006946 [Gryganskiella cystojenkinii]|nr:hypothetical protein BGZ83_006946 [Gryganskiella cystojenkinii]
MPPAPAAKAQAMSISELCQQNDSEEDLVLHHNNRPNKQGLDQDPLDLNDNSNHYQHHNKGLNHNNGYSNGQQHQHQHPSSDDEFEEFEDSPRSRTNNRPDPAAEQLAAEVLGDMANANRTSSSSTSDSSSSGTFATPATPFISRMSSLPLVNSALKAYESGKQNSKVMKYGAEMVESSVKSLSKPVFDKLEPKLGQLDDFACRQLDKVYPAKSDSQTALPSPTSSARSSNDIAPESRPNGASATATGSSYFAYRSRGDSIDSNASNTSSRQSFDILRSRSTRHEEATLRQRSESQSSQRSFHLPPGSGYYPQQPPSSQQHQQQQVGGVSTAPSQQFSGWRGVVATVGTASAAGVAIFSEESMKSLKYCLQWLQYAVQHIDHQISLLRAFLVSLANPSQNRDLVVPSNAASTLASIKKEVVETLRKVIQVVSRYAGACLPDQAKISVRQFILSMPVRWATLNNNESVPSTPMGSPSLGPRSDRNPDEAAALNDTSERATKVLVLAHESSDMLKSVASIFKDSVDKAENWMDKLRYVGMNPQNNSEGLPSWAPTGFPGTPGGSMPGGFPGSGGSTGLEQYSLRQTQQHHSSSSLASTATGGLNDGGISSTSSSHPSSGMGSPSKSLKSSPFRHSQRHAYRQNENAMSADEDSVSEEEMGMDDSANEEEMDEATLLSSALEGDQTPGVHAPLKRSMGSATGNSTLDNADSSVRRRKKRGESSEYVASNGHHQAYIKQEQMN